MHRPVLKRHTPRLVSILQRLDRGVKDTRGAHIATRRLRIDPEAPTAPLNQFAPDQLCAHNAGGFKGLLRICVNRSWDSEQHAGTVSARRLMIVVTVIDRSVAAGSSREGEHTYRNSAMMTTTTATPIAVTTPIDARDIR
jgi:hypothetical protein